jgi:ABC-type multidrug transport system ATPase subunit
VSTGARAAILPGVEGPPGNGPVLRVENVRKVYGRKFRRGGVIALDGVTLEVGRGRIFGLLGPNGAGKTTFCKILNALVVPTAGRVTVEGLESIRHHHELAREMVTVFGGESDLFGLFTERLSCEHNLRFIGDLWGLPREVTRARIEETLDVLDLQEKREEWYQKLSGGTKQKLFLAIPLILRRRIVVLDEPTIRLDVPTRRKMQDLIRGVLNREHGCTILLTTHDMAEAEKLCDRVGILKDGRMLLVDTPHRLRMRSSQGPRLRVRLRLDPAAGRDDASLRRSLEPLGPRLRLEADPESDGRRADGLHGYVIRVPPASPGDPGAIPQVIGLLCERGFAPQHLTVEEPTLEDLFVEILGNGGP